MKIAAFTLTLAIGATPALAHVGSHASSTHTHNWLAVGLVSFLMLGVAGGLLFRTMKRRKAERAEKHAKLSASQAVK